MVPEKSIEKALTILKEQLRSEKKKKRKTKAIFYHLYLDITK